MADAAGIEPRLVTDAVTISPRLARDIARAVLRHEAGSTVAAATVADWMRHVLERDGVLAPRAGMDESSVHLGGGVSGHPV